MTRMSGLMRWMSRRAASTLRMPIVSDQASACRLMLLGATSSPSTTMIVPTAPRASASMQFEPTPPAPTTMTVAAR